MITTEELQTKLDKIISYKTYSKKKKTDSMLELDADMYTQLGIDSTKEEIEAVHKNSVVIFRAMKKIDWELGSAMLHSMGKMM